MQVWKIVICIASAVGPTISFLFINVQTALLDLWDVARILGTTNLNSLGDQSTRTIPQISSVGQITSINQTPRQLQQDLSFRYPAAFGCKQNDRLGLPDADIPFTDCITTQHHELEYPINAGHHWLQQYKDKESTGEKERAVEVLTSKSDQNLSESLQNQPFRKLFRRASGKNGDISRQVSPGRASKFESNRRKPVTSPETPQRNSVLSPSRNGNGASSSRKAKTVYSNTSSSRSQSPVKFSTEDLHPSRKPRIPAPQRSSQIKAFRAIANAKSSTTSLDKFSDLSLHEPSPTTKDANGRQPKISGSGSIRRQGNDKLPKGSTNPPGLVFASVLALPPAIIHAGNTGPTQSRRIPDDRWDYTGVAHHQKAVAGANTSPGGSAFAHARGNRVAMRVRTEPNQASGFVHIMKDDFTTFDHVPPGEDMEVIARGRTPDQQVYGFAGVYGHGTVEGKGDVPPPPYGL